MRACWKAGREVEKEVETLSIRFGIKKKGNRKPAIPLDFIGSGARI